MRVHDYEVCASTASTDLTPYDSQYEGYMGNYGNTLNRWYRRPRLSCGRASGPSRHCADRLRAVCERPPRAADDWSVAWAGCGCERCSVLGAFLGARSRRVLEWPLAKEGRRHVHTRIDSAELPVRHQSRRQGRPYTLVLTKTQELFTREQTVRRQAAADLAWLMSLRNG
ncbi:hypothetical protein ACWD48_21205 [Streptomyces sp. NPDC002519]